jgi:biopolymer transport protein ExbD
MQRKTEDNATVAMLVDENGKRTFFLNDDEMELPTIKTELADTILKNEYLLVVIRADSTAPTQWVMELLELARDAGAQRVALSTKRVKEEDEATETE